MKLGEHQDSGRIPAIPWGCDRVYVVELLSVDGQPVQQQTRCTERARWHYIDLRGNREYWLCDKHDSAQTKAYAAKFGIDREEVPGA